MDQQSSQKRAEDGIEMVDFVLSNPQRQSQFSLVDKLSFAEVMQFADLGPKISEDDNSYFVDVGSSPVSMSRNLGLVRIGDEVRLSENGSTVQEELNGLVGRVGKQHVVGASEATKSRRKRARSNKTSEEAESQRMTHIAVERNRRRQMNEHLRMLRSLMPGSYVQRGDQASIIGGAIEFVRELEQLLQCLESQKRRRLFGNNNEAPIRPQIMDTIPSQYPLIPDQHNSLNIDLDPNSVNGEETAENKSRVADIEVRLQGFDAMIKILSRRRPGQLINTIAALEELHLNILHTNVTTIDQTVLYSFNVKMISETRYSAEDIANSVQQILSFIESSTI